MKLISLFATTAIAGIVAISSVPLQALNPSSYQASANEVRTTIVATAQEKIDQISAVKGMPGSGALLRKLYAKDLTPIGIQVGGAGMVVNLYSKTDDTTLSLCTTFDVVVAVKSGWIAEFDPSEVK
jgi:hypothetical protein